MSSADYSFGALSRLRFGKVVGEFGGSLADLVEDVEQHLLALGADAIDELAGDLLDRGQYFVEECLRGWRDVNEYPATVAGIAAARDVVLPLEVVEQRGDGAAGDVHACCDFAGQHGLAFAFDDRERVQRGV